MSPTLIHWKCTYDQLWNYASMAKNLFGSNKCLVVAEKMECNAHVHFQGYTDHSDRKLEDIKNDMSDWHFSVKAWEAEKKRAKEGDKIRGRPRPVKSSQKEIDEKGFQYLCKEDRPPLYSQGFTQDDLLALRKASDEHVQQLKNGLKEHLHKIIFDKKPEPAFESMRLEACEYYEREAKRPRPSFQKDVLWTMWSHPQRDDAWKTFVSSKL